MRLQPGPFYPFVAVLLAASVTPAAEPIRGRVKSRQAPAAVAATESVAAPRAPQPAARPEGTLAAAIGQLQSAREALESVRDYTCTFSKREVVSRKVSAQTMSLKFRREPFSVYMLFGGPEKGREVLFVNGQNGNKLLVHENVAVLGSVTIPLAINAPEVSRESRYPITNIGLHKLADTVLAQLQAESRADDATVEEFPNARLGDTSCHAFRITFAQPKQGRKFHQSVLYFDRETNYLVRVEQYGFPRRAGEKPPQLEEYSYTSIETNVGLTDRDFDPRNRAYHFQ